MEHALFIDVVRDMDALESVCQGHTSSLSDRGWQWLYVGSETCEHRLPDLDLLARAIDFCGRQGMSLALVTPPVTEFGAQHVATLVGVLPAGTEVIVNDWSTLETARRAGCRPIFGRVMNRLVRDPRIQLHELPPELQRFSRQSLVHAPMMQDLLRREGFVRVELENVPQGQDPLPSGSIPTSIHFPHMLVSIGRHCGPRFAARCPGRPCFESFTSVNHVSIQFDGIASFALRPVLPEDLPSLGVDRLVRTIGCEGVGWLASEGSAAGWPDVHARRLQSRGDMPFVDVIPDFLMSMLAENSRAVFEPGCGFGTHLQAFADAGVKVKGIDVSSVAVEVARQRLGEDSVLLGDFLTTQIPGKFDLVLDLGSLHAILPAQRKEWINKLRSVMTDDGWIVAFWFVRDPRLNPDEPVVLVDGSVAEWGFTETELDALLAPYFVRSWTVEIPADGDCPAKRLMLLSRRGAGEKRSVRLVEALEAMNPVQFYPADFSDPAVRKMSIPDDFSVVADWLTPDQVDQLQKAGFQLVAQVQRLNGQKEVDFQVHAHPVTLHFAPLSLNIPHYRIVGGYQVAYRHTGAEMPDIDRLIDTLAAFLPPTES